MGRHSRTKRLSTSARTTSAGEFPPGEKSVEYRRGRPSLTGDTLVGDEEILASIGMTEADVDAIAEACEAGDYSMWDSSKVSYGSPLKEENGNTQSGAKPTAQ